MNTYVTGLGPLLTLGLGLIGGLVWLIRLEGTVRLEQKLREALQDRLNGFESRIYEVLRRIEDKLDSKADKD